ncbi:MAG: hypothetical protein MPJ78_19145 [Hyphomicrobiaceae bacterium]|nr:hypothetical protein [Hyphomicrobiaceae bacterium]
MSKKAKVVKSPKGAILVLNNSESFWTKFSLSIFDKLFLSAILLFVGAYVQAQFARDTYETELLSQMFRAQSELIAPRRNELVQQVGEFIAVGEGVIHTNDKLDGVPFRLEKELRGVRNTVHSLAAFYSRDDIVRAFDPLDTSMQRLLAIVSQGAPGPKLVQDMTAAIAKVREDSRVYFSKIEKASLDEAKSDTDEFLKMLRKSGK